MIEISVGRVRNGKHTTIIIAKATTTNNKTKKQTNTNNCKTNKSQQFQPALLTSSCDCCSNVHSYTQVFYSISLSWLHQTFMTNSIMDLYNIILACVLQSRVATSEFDM